MNAADFVEFAGRLAAMQQVGPHEARCRSAVSRAYYGAFHAVSELLRSWDVVVRRNSFGHQDAIDALRRSQHPVAREIGGALDNLRQARIRADYRLEGQLIAEKFAMNSVEEANEVLSLIERCKRDTEFRLAVTAIREF